MDMKKILQAVDGAKAKAEVNSSGMRKFLQVVKEAELNQKTAPVTKPVPSKPVTAPSGNLTADEMVSILSGQKTQAQIMADREAKKADPRVKEGLVDGSGNPVLSGSGQAVQTGQPATAPAPAQPQIDPANYKVPSIEFLKKNYEHPADIIDGGTRSETEPDRLGAWNGISDFADLMLALDASYYRARKADPNYKQPAFVKDDWELIQRMLGTPEGKEYAIDTKIGLSSIHDKSTDAEFNRAQHKEFEKQSNAKILAQKSDVIKPGWKYDQELGMTPAQAELQKQKAAPVKENTGMSRLLSIVTEGRGPLNRATTAEAITMKHYTAPVLNVAKNATPSMIGKYFKAVEEELREAAGRPNDRAQQLAERVIKKVIEQDITRRVTPNADGSFPDPSINRLTGKPNPPAAEPAPSNVKPSGSTVDYGGATYSVSVFGDGIRPRIGRSDKVVTAKAYVVGDKMYVLLDPSTQEGLSEDSDPCWDSHKMVGTKKKGGKTVPNCVPKEAVNPAQQAAIAIAKKKAGKK